MLKPDIFFKKHGGVRTILCFIAIVVIAATVVTSRGQSVDPADDNPDRVVPVIPTANRYDSGRVFLERADRLLKPAADVEYQVLIGNVLFRRGDMYMYCDSAHFYDATNSLQAFGNVKMEQGDTLFVFADELDYTDSTELAVLYADPGKKVRLINRDVELRTDIFNYDMGIELGYYEVGGELTDKQNRLTSIYGEYAPNTKDAIFRNRVHLNSLSETDTLNIFTEALHYNTDTHIADLTEISTITSKDGTIYTDNGVYNTETTIADLYERSLVVTKTGKTLTGDTLFYDRKAGYGQAWGSIILNDTVNKSKLLGDYGFYNELTDSAFVTGNALAVDYSSVDSLSLHGDTIKAFTVITRTLQPIQHPTPVEPVQADIEADTIAEDMVISEQLQPDSATAIVDSVTVDLVDTLGVEISDPQSVEVEWIDSDTLAVEPAAPLTVDTLTVDTLAIDVPAVDSVAVDSLSMVGAVEADSLALEPVVIDTPELEPVVPLPLIPDTEEIADTTHYIVAYPNVRFFRSDLQGVCDSMTFVQRDSLLHMDRDPLVWSGERQIFGEKIIVHMNDSTADRVTLPSSAFMAEMLEEGYYNQLSGREMVAYLAEKTLKHLDVSGNVMLVFFPMEEDSTYNKVANAESSFLAADFVKGQIEKMKMWPQSTEVITPLYLAKKSLFFLNGFRWEADRRPSGHDDLMPKPAPVDTTAGMTTPADSVTGIIVPADSAAALIAPVDTTSILLPSDSLATPVAAGVGTDVPEQVEPSAETPAAEAPESEPSPVPETAIPNPETPLQPSNDE